MGPPSETGQERDEEWFNATYAAHYPYIFRYCIRRIGDPDACVELAQDVFVIAWRRRAGVPDECLPWLYQVARRVLANHRRASRTGPRLVPLSEPDLLAQYADTGRTDGDSASAVADIRAALATLPEPYQEILRLVGWEELTAAEAAIVLGCSRTAATVRLHRARRRLLAALDTSNRVTGGNSVRGTAPAGTRPEGNRHV